MRTLEQLRAHDALQSIHNLPNDDALRQWYRTYTERLAPGILMNGLGQALASEQAAAGDKGDENKDPKKRAHALLYRNVQRWLCREGGIYPGASEVLQAMMQEDQSHYVRAQAEALAWLEWHKKFCRAYLPKGEGD